MTKHPLMIAVVGGGAAGLLASITAAEQIARCRLNANVLLLEANPRIGKKILVTGNGRCNLTNRHIGENHYYGDTGLFRSIYPLFTNDDLIRFFENAGVPVRTDFAGRVYPMSNQAQSVLDALRYELQRLPVRVLTDTKITGIKKTEKGFLLNGSIYADICILTTGGKASPVQGSDGSGYALLKQLNQPLTPVFPALTALRVGDFTKSLKGIRAEGEIRVKYKGRVLSSARGEIQYTDYGLSGIPAMTVSREVSRLLNTQNEREVTVTVDAAPDFSEEQLQLSLTNLMQHNPDLPCEMLLAGFMPKRLGVFLLTQCSLSPVKPVQILNNAALHQLVREIKYKKYKIVSVNGFQDAQVTAGGADADFIVADTLESKITKGLFLAGELLNLDGECGGYNLQWAFSSGYVAGKSAVTEIMNRASDK